MTQRSRPLRVGCIADDFTGATDLANTFVRGGLRAMQLIGVPTRTELAAADDMDVLVVALKSRTAPVEQAVAESLAALRWLQTQGAQRIYFKICSTFDSTPAGNVGPVAEALMQALGCTFSVATPAFPENGRTVFKGHLFVGDVLLSESGMRHHPLTPMTDANLVRVLQAQSRGVVGLVDHRSVAAGVDAIRQRMVELQADGCRQAIVDASSDEDLLHIGAAVVDLPLVTAGSGLAKGLAHALGARPGAAAAGFPKASGRRAVVSGSCSQMTQRQVQAHRDAGQPLFELDALQLAAGVPVVQQALAWALDQPLQAVPLIYSTADASEVKRVQQQLGTAHAGEMVEAALAAVAQGLVAQGVRQLVVAGGETSGACVKALGITALGIGAQIAPGVPWCYATTGVLPTVGLHLALKSGNFGGERFFTDAFEVLA
jgi:3-dehydrotetronate 4-kinase